MLTKLTTVRARPIANKEIFSFVKKNVNSKFLYQKDLHKKFLNKYFKWIQKSSLNKLKGIKKFKYLSFVHGTSQAFDEFYSSNKGKRFRCFKILPFPFIC